MVESGSCGISVQVLQEFHVNFARKGKTQEEAAQIIADFTLWPIVDNTLPLFLLGLNLQRRWQLSLWDSMILQPPRPVVPANF